MFDGYALFEFSELIRLHVIRKKCINQSLVDFIAVSCSDRQLCIGRTHGAYGDGFYSWEGRYEMGLYYYFGMMTV